MHTTSIFLFHRDLRLYDNTGFITACKASHKVIPLFIFDPVQVSAKNTYKSAYSVRFMIESLFDLNSSQQLDGHLICLYGDTLTILNYLFKSTNVDAIYFNMDYTPFAKTRDTAIHKLAESYSIACHAIEDITLLPISTIPYKKFTPFFRAYSKIHVNLPNNYRPPRNKIITLNATKYKISLSDAMKKCGVNNLGHIYKAIEKLPIVNQRLTYKAIEKLPIVNQRLTYKAIEKLPIVNQRSTYKGGRTEGKRILKTISRKRFGGYNKDRNYPALDATTHLSAYNKFGCISIREVYWTFRINLGTKNTLIQQLYWRDFYYLMQYHNIGIEVYGKYNRLKWNRSESAFTKWCEGRTGFPIVDAAMTQLNHTGFMHNRCRMIVADFLIKHLHIDWRWGEKYFATHLVDYDPIQNMYGWTWVLIQPYFRIFNPWVQSHKWDPDCVYIKKWLPILVDVPARNIHQWYKYYDEQVGYPKHMLDHEEEAKVAKKRYKLIED
jgi:deoxyribodipyrimidine photo-lyase